MVKLDLNAFNSSAVGVRSSNVNRVRHVKATVEMQKKEDASRDITWLRPCPFGTCRLTPHGAGEATSPAGVAVAPALLSAAARSASAVCKSQPNCDTVTQRYYNLVRIEARCSLLEVYVAGTVQQRW